MGQTEGRGTVPRLHDRDSGIDALRGVGIAMVLFSHVLSKAAIPPEASAVRWALVTVLDLSNVQLLAFASGMVAHESSVGRRAKTLLIPLLAWGVIEVLVSLRSLPSWSAVREFVVGTQTGANQYWFLWALFVALALAVPMRRLSRPFLWALAAISAAVWPFMPAWTLVRGAALLLPFLVLGMEWVRAGSGLTARAESLWPFLGAGMLATSFVVARTLNGELWVGSVVPWHVAWVPLLGTAAGLLACVGWLGAIRRLRGWAVSVLAGLGVASMGVYGVHGVTLSALSSVFVPRSLASALVFAAALIPFSFGVTWLLTLNAWMRRLLLGGRGATLGTPRRRTTSGRVGG
jgi:fucose 4-O-acetylase-like acetyltransferase